MMAQKPDRPRAKSSEGELSSDPPLGPYGWLNEFNRRKIVEPDKRAERRIVSATDYFKSVQVKAADVQKFAASVLTHPELVGVLERQIKQGGEYEDLDESDTSLLSAYTGYYCWKNGIHEDKAVSYSFGYQLTREVLSGRLKEIESQEAVDFLRISPGIV